ncbi:MAG: lipid biosynthesis B12-binding/radical SAM protein [Desulfosarcinaceae bacterium]
MKVLLISPNPERLPDPVFPIGAAYIAAALKAAGIGCRCLDLCFEENVAGALGQAVREQAPDLIALSLRNVDNVSWPHAVSYLPFYKEVVTLLRSLSQAPIVLGGSGYTLLPQELLNYLKADFGIAGEGEAALVGLAEHLGGQAPLEQLADGRILRPGDFPAPDLDRLPRPDRGAFDSALYLRRGGMGSLQTKRGCPFNCVYCTYPLIEGRQVRVRDPKLICDEIEALLEQGLTTLFIVDNAFNFPMNHAEAVCREIIRRGLVFRWSCYANPAFITSELVDLMQRAGCTSLEFGTDAGCDGMLAGMGKNFSAAQILETSRICHASGMPFCHSLLLGGPGETMQTVERTIAAIDRTQPTAVICMVGIRIFPRTRLAAIAQQEGRIRPGEDFLQTRFYLADAIAAPILDHLQSLARSHPTWIFPGLQININTSLQQKLRRFGVKGPLWEYMKVGRQR